MPVPVAAWPLVQDQAKKRKPEMQRDTPPPPEQSPPRPVSLAARMLALAHYVERLVEDETDAARQLGVRRARMSQILNLLNLAPRVQEELLLGDLHLSERGVREVAAGVVWEGQRDD